MFLGLPSPTGALDSRRPAAGRRVGAPLADLASERRSGGPLAVAIGSLGVAAIAGRSALLRDACDYHLRRRPAGRSRLVGSWSASGRQPARAASQHFFQDVLAQPLCGALLAFASYGCDLCIEWLGHVRHVSDRCGGSLAQCDLVQLTFIEAALRARNAHLARALVAERVAQRPASPLNRLLRRRLRAMTGSESWAN